MTDRRPSPTTALLRAQLRSVRNLWHHSATRSKLRATVGLGLALITFLAFHYGTHAFILFVDNETPLAESLAERLVQAVLLLQVLVVGFSVLLSALVQLFASDDTPYLATLPVPERTIFTSKALAVAFYAGWMPTLIAMSVVSAVGRFYEAPAIFYPAALLILLACLAVPVLLSLGVAATGARLISLHRARHFSLLFFGILAGAILLTLLWRLEPRRLAELDGINGLASAINHLRFRSAGYLPVGDATEITLGIAKRGELNPAPIFRLLGWLVASAGLGYLLFLQSFRQALSLAREARQRPSSPQTSKPLRPSQLFILLLGRAPAAVVAKDVKLFVRDPSQWTQVVFLLVLVVLYLSSAASIPVDGLAGVRLPVWARSMILPYASFVLSGLVLSAVALRFLFTSVSAEGRAAWLIFSAPIDARMILRAKTAAAYPLLATLGLILVVGSGLLLDATLSTLLWSGLGILLVTAGLTGLAVGLGGVMANFKASHPIKVSSGFGGLTFSASAITYVSAMGVLLFFPAMWFSDFRSPHSPPEDLGTFLAVGLLVIAVVATVAVSVLPMRAAARALEFSGR